MKLPELASDKIDNRWKTEYDTIDIEISAFDIGNGRKAAILFCCRVIISLLCKLLYK